MFTTIKEKIKKLYVTKIKKQTMMEYRISCYRKCGISIGDNCLLYSDLSTSRDCFLLNIGNNVIVSGRVTFLLHDGAIKSISHNEYSETLGRIIIGDNSFIGFGSIILPGVEIANNTIVAAGSVVTKSIKKEGYIIGGNPAKIIGSVEQFKIKNKDYFVNLKQMTREEVEIFVNQNQDRLIRKRYLDIG